MENLNKRGIHVHYEAWKIPLNNKPDNKGMRILLLFPGTEGEASCAFAVEIYQQQMLGGHGPAGREWVHVSTRRQGGHISALVCMRALFLPGIKTITRRGVF